MVACSDVVIVATRVSGQNRETGAIPVRSRRCMRGRKPQKPLICTQTDREGAAGRAIRESEDLP